ncbi:MAG: hypothetical protein AAF211_14550 [Myxococcota bacterium]
MVRVVWSVLLVACGAGADDPPGAVDDTGPAPEPEGCTTWIGTYDLTGTTFRIDSVQDFAITVQEPYDADENMGPGTLQVRFADAGGQAGDGPISVTSYALRWWYRVGIPAAFVETDIQAAGADACGIASGTLAGETATWSPAELAICRQGEVSCTGLLCGIGGSPVEGEPEQIDNCDPLDLNDFVFADDFATLAMTEVAVSEETGQDLVGTLVDLVADPDTPACACP